jgi:recombination protein RecT
VSQTTSALAKRQQQTADRQRTLAQKIEQMKPEIARALPRHLNPDRVARIAVTVMRRTPKLAECTPESFLGALMTCAQLGLEPGPLGHAYLVQSVNARVVRVGDEFDYAFGLDPKLEHKPKADVDQVITHVYAVVRLKDGGADFDVMTRAEVEAIRKRSRAAKDGPWVTDYAEMAKKTVLRRLLKTAPMSVEYQQAVANDEQTRTSTVLDDIDLSVPLDDAEAIDGEVVDEPEPGDWPAAAEPGSGATDA